MSTPLQFTSELEIPDDGADNDVWGLYNNALWSAWDRHFGGWAYGDVSSADWTVDSTDAQCGRLYVTGNPTPLRKIVLPANDRTYLVANLSTAAQGSINVECAGGSSLPLPNGCAQLLTPSSDLLEIIAGGPLVAVGGGHADLAKLPTQDWYGPGIYFSGDRNQGFGRISSTSVGVFATGADKAASMLLVSTPGVSQGLVFRGEAAAPYQQGIFVESSVGATKRLLFTASGAVRMIVGPGGIAIGAANGPLADGTINAEGYYREGVALPVQRAKTISGLSSAANSQLSSPHGMGSAPTLVIGRLDCISPDQGYANGDRVRIDGSGGNGAIIVGGNATQLFYRINDTYQIAPKTGTGGAVNINPAAWRVAIIGLWP